nr:retrovirus-related Pol polyprotein from transposon TNT 1-94 [Tanacetum cinerariifolium]
PSSAKPAQDISYATRPMEPIIEDWVSDSEDEGVDHLIKDCNFHAKPKTQPTPKNSAHRGYDKQYASSTKKYSPKHIVLAVVITMSKPVSVTAARPVSAAVLKIIATKPRHARSLHTKTNLNIRRHKTRSRFSKTSNSFLKVTVAHAKIVSAAKGKKGKRGGKITGKGKIKIGKQHRASCKTKPVSSVTQPIFRLHMDLFGPIFVKSLSKKCYCLVITDDYSRFTWVFFLATKDETSSILKTFVTGLENQLSLRVKVIRSDNETEFKNSDLNQFYEIKGIKREFSVPKTPQQNGIAERKNMTLIKAARTMPVDSLLPIPFWAKAVNTACYVQNRVLVTKPQNKTPYELLHGRPSSIGFMRPFGCPVTILNTLDSLGKFERKVDEGFLVGYFVNSKAFRVFNSRIRIVQETLHVNFLENKENIAGTGPTWLFDIDSLTRTINYQPVTAGNQSNPSAEGDATFDSNEHSAEHPKSTINLSPSSSALSIEQDNITKKRDKGKSLVDYFTGNRDFIEDFEDYSEDSSNDVSAAGPIVPTAGLIHGNSSFQNASQSHDMLKNEDIVYSDHENDGAEADFNNLETSITEPKRVYQALKDPSWIEAMKEELLQFKMQKVWILVDLPHEKRAIGFEDPDHPDKVYKVVKALYGLHQAPRAWYETLATYLLENGFHIGQIDQTLFIKKEKGDILLVQIYVKQKKDGIFINQDKYVAEILKKFRLTEGKSASTPIDTEKPLLKDPDGEDVDVHIYRFMIGSLMYLTSSRLDIMFAWPTRTVIMLVQAWTENIQLEDVNSLEVD